MGSEVAPPAEEVAPSEVVAPSEGSRRAEVDGDLAALDALGVELDEVEAALRRIDDGSYGLCSRCGAAIDQESLAGDPLALACVTHAH